MASSEEASPSRHYRGDIDGLRAVAILLVILYHSGMHLFQGGYTGVDVFFVISGYLIGGQIYSDKRDGVFSYWSFYYRRSRRILPALFAVLAFVLIAAICTFPPVELHACGISVCSVALSISNLHFSRWLGYFAPRADLNPLLMTWSLGVEEQFYLVIPFILSLLVRMRHTLRLPALVAVCLLSFSFCILPGSGQAAFYLLSCRFWELGAGVILAVLATNRDSAYFGNAICNAGGIAGALLICIPLLIARSNTIQVVQLLPAVLGAAFLIATPSSWINSYILASSPARFVGRISYSWYLWHWPLLALLRFYSGDSPRPMLIAITIAISFCVAVASYFLIEQPFRKRSQPAKPAVFRYGALCLIIAAGGIGLRELKGIPQRFPQLADLSREQITRETDPCLVDGDKPNLSSKCYSITGTRPAIAMWGDSHGAALSPEFRDYAANHGYDFAQITKKGCRPSTVNTVDREMAPYLIACFRFNETSLDTIAGDGRIQIVVIASSWKKIFQEDRNRCVAEDCFAYLKASIRRLQSCGKKVIVFGDVPVFDIDPVPLAYFSQLWVWREMNHLMGYPYPREVGGLSLESEALDDRTEFALRRAVNELPGVQYVELHDLFCAENGCRFSQNGKVLYLDEQHLSKDGANLALTRLQLNARKAEIPTKNSE